MMFTFLPKLFHKIIIKVFNEFKQNSLSLSLFLARRIYIIIHFQILHISALRGIKFLQNSKGSNDRSYLINRVNHPSSFVVLHKYYDVIRRCLDAKYVSITQKRSFLTRTFSYTSVFHTV